jgi:hypothetical protein
MQLITPGECGPQDLPQLVKYCVEDGQSIPSFFGWCLAGMLGEG